MATKLFLSKDPKGILCSGFSRTGSVLARAFEYTGISGAAHTLSGLKTGQQKHGYYWVRSHFFFRVPEGVDNLERRGTKELKRRLSVQKIEPQSDSINQAIDFLTSFDIDWLPQLHGPLEASPFKLVT